MEPSNEVSPTSADVDGASEKNSVEKCKHFSMRKYVSEMRQKDARKCWPFKLDCILSEVPKDVLPPLEVPKYRWWRCPHCLPEFWVTATDTENGAVPDASCGKCKFAGPFADAVRLSETATVASNFPLMLNLDMEEVKESNPSVSSETSPKRCNTSVLCVVDKRDDIARNHSKIIKDFDANNGKREPADKYDQGLNFAEFPSCYEGTGSLAAVNAENDSETVDIEKKAIDRKLTEACENEGVGLLDNIVDGDNGLAPAEPDRRHSPSSDSTEVGPYMAGSSYRRKARKVRLLTDLLAAVDDSSNKHIRKDNAPLLAICDASQVTRKQADAEVEMEYCANVKKVGLRKKRKLASEDLIKCSEGVPSIQENENPPMLTIIAKNSDIVLDSQPEENGFTRILSQTSKKNNLPENVNEVTNSIRKKKKINKVNGNSCEMKSIDAKVKYACTSSDGKEFIGREVGIAVPSVPEIRKNTNTCFFLEKTNLPAMRPDQVPVIPRVIPSHLGHSLARMDFNLGENHPAYDQFWSTKPSSAVNGANLLSKSSSNASSEDVPMESNFVKDNTDSRSIHADLSFPSRHGLDAFWSNGVNGVVNDRIESRIPFLSDRQQRYANKVVDSCSFWTPNLEISGASNKKKAFKHLEHATLMPQCRDKSADPGNPDDIPMEIVELMAKHQYERRLPDAEMDNSRTGKNLWLEECSQKRKFSDNLPNVVASKDFRSTTQKSFGLFSESGANSYKMSQLERFHTPPVHHTFFQDKGLPPKFQTISGSGLANTLKSTMNEDCSSIKVSDGNFLSLGVSGMWYPPKHNEVSAARFSSMRPDRIPFVHNMMPQSCSFHSNIIDFHPCGPKTPPKVEMNCNRDPNIFPSRDNCLQKQEINFDVYRGETKNPYNSRHDGMEFEPMVTSIDVSSNETIPAMHLLSLMDAGMHSGKKIRFDEDPRLAKQPSLSCEYHSKEVCGLHLGMCKAYIPLKHPSLDLDQAKILPGFSPSASSSRPTGLFRSGNDDGKPFVPLDMNDKGKGKCYEVGRPIGNSRFLSFLAHDSTGRETSYGFKPYHSRERNVPGSSEGRIISPYHRISERETIEARNGIHMTQPLRTSADAMICMLNRNPAEFSVPEEGNIYSLGRDELKLVKRLRNSPEMSTARCCGVKKMTKAKRAAGRRQNNPQIA